MQLVLAIAFCLAFALSIAFVLLARKLAPAAGLVDHPGGRKAHARPIPLGGGVAIFAAWALPLLAVGVLSWLWTRNPSVAAMPAAVESDVRLAAGRLGLLLWLVLGGAACVGFGLWDDAKNMGPWAKLFSQLVVAVGIALVPEMRLTVFISARWIHIGLTALWILVLMNSFNLLDNMDGQSGLVAVLTGGALVVLALETHQFFIAGMLLVLLGAVLGFLLFNMPPATIFMGDAGSMFIGYALAVATALTTFVTPGHTNRIFPLLVPLIIFAVPLYDTLSVVVLRLRRRKPLMEADRNHFAHRLMALGMSERMVLGTLGLTVVATSLGATVPYGTPTWRVLAPAVQAGAVLLVILLLEVAGTRSRMGGTEG